MVGHGARTAFAVLSVGSLREEFYPREEPVQGLPTSCPDKRGGVRSLDFGSRRLAGGEAVATSAVRFRACKEVWGLGRYCVRSSLVFVCKGATRVLTW